MKIKTAVFVLFTINFIFKNSFCFHNMEELEKYKEIQKNDLKMVITELIAQKKDLNQEYHFGPYTNFPLKEAIDCKDPELVKLLLNNCANINKDNEIDLLKAAIYTGNIKIIELLIKAGANINASSGDTLLVSSLTTPNNRKAVVKFLLEQGANPNIKNKYEDTVLLTAVKECNFQTWRTSYMTEIIKLLIYHGADISVCNSANDSVGKEDDEDYGKNFIELARDEKFRKELQDIVEEIQKTFTEKLEVWYV